MGQSLEEDSGKKLTPYQGILRAMGKFCCSKCSNIWFSAYSWRDTSQKCLECGIEVYPINQWKLKPKRRPSRDHDPSKTHKEDLCGKCREIRSSCTKLSCLRRRKTNNK